MSAVLDKLREVEAINCDINSARRRLARLYKASEDSNAISAAMHKKITEIQDGILAHIVDAECRILDMETWLDRLGGKRSQVIRLRYFEGMPWCEVAAQLRYSERRCMQIHDEAIEALSEMEVLH